MKESRVIDIVAGARPNFMKIAPVVRALDAAGQKSFSGESLWRIVHTGQHYDFAMNGVFFEQLGIPSPEVHLGVGSGSHGAQTARILELYEAHIVSARPAATVVFGDVNSTAACALAAVKLQIPVVHVEAGLRSFDRSMPEEINRLVTDALSELLFVSEPSGLENLKREGIDEGKVKFVGNVMIDTLVRELPEARKLDVCSRFGLKPGGYGLVTLHRPSNVDDPRVLSRLLFLLSDLSRELPLVFPMHPRTKKAADQAGLSHVLENNSRFVAVDPIPYRENLCLMADAGIVLTDSGGMQEETSFLHIPCLTLRENTERPVTLTKGTSRLVGNDPERIRSAFQDVLSGRWKKGEDIALWDGHTGERIAEILIHRFGA